MPDQFAIGTDWFNRTLKNNASRGILIADREHNPAVTLNIPAASGSSEWTEDETESVIHTFDTRDWIVDAADLVDTFGQPVRPKRGWIITDELDGDRYEVYAPPGVRPWRYSDRANKRIRIHTRNLAR